MTFGKRTTVSELYTIIHNYRRLTEDDGWLAFDAWVNRRMEALRKEYPYRNVDGMSIQVLFKDDA